MSIRVLIVAGLCAFSPVANASALPGAEDGPAALPPDPFPDRMSAFVWRNWFCVSVDRMAKTVSATSDDLGRLAAEMGLPSQPEIDPLWQRKGYITILRRNWHLLPYDQLLILLDMTEKELGYCLKEYDFLFGKLGELKPQCGRLTWCAEGSAKEKKARQRIARIIREEGLCDFSEEPRFAFFRELCRARSDEVVLKPSADEAFDFRMVSSYCAEYGDPLADPEIGSFPEGLLQRLSVQGVNAVWMHVVLNTLWKDPKYPEFGVGGEERLANLQKLVDRAARYGIKVYLYMNEPRCVPASFFDRADRKPLCGYVDKSRGLATLCTSEPEVRRWLRDSLKGVFSTVKGLGGIFTITMSENLTNCASLGCKDECPRCRSRTVSDVLAEVNCDMVEGMRAGDPGAQAYIWNWQWPVEDEAAIIARLPKTGCRLLAVSEKGIVVDRAGAAIPLADYSISVVGPGEEALRFWWEGRKNGLPVSAKVQAACSWELSSFPYLPTMDLVAEHALNLKNAGVGGVMLSWSCGSAPCINLDVYQELRKGDSSIGPVLDRLARKCYGDDAVPYVRKAWSAFSAGFREFPFDVVVLYKGPQQVGPANPLYMKPTGYQATMVGIPYDGFDFGTWDNKWIGRCSPDGWIDQFDKVAKGFEQGVELFAKAIPHVSAEGREEAERELRMFRAEQMHFASCVDQARFIRARNRNDRLGMVESARRELSRAKEYLPLMRGDSRIGYECSNHYYAIPQDVREKIIGCRMILEELGPVAGQRAKLSDGDVRIECPDAAGWKFNLSVVTSNDVEYVTVCLRSEKIAVPPPFKVEFDAGGMGVRNVWTPYSERYMPRPDGWGDYPYVSSLAEHAPIAAAFGNDANRLTVAASEALRKVDYALVVNANTCRLTGRFGFFSQQEAPMTTYSVILRIDRRRCFWSQAVEDASAWISSCAGLKPCPVPASAYDPVYSSWYAFDQDVWADSMESEAKAAVELGMKTAILDDGWQKSTSRTFYSGTGDWMPVGMRFSDMKGHVNKVHQNGLRYILWIALPLVGDESETWRRFHDKFLFVHKGGAAVLDPRFPEVREHLCHVCERAVRDWDFDGLKLDFIDQFSFCCTDPDTTESSGPIADRAIAENYAGRDIHSLPLAVDRLMSDVRARIAAIKPDALIEFRQYYMGPAIRQYGNMIRGMDCPADLHKNRKQICDLRLTSGGTAVHADMLVWCADEDVEGAAQSVLSALFGTIQYSMRLASIPTAHRAMIRHWIEFSVRHQDALLKGKFMPHHPELGYPKVEAESDSERIVAVYAEGQTVSLRDAKKCIVVNATTESLIAINAQVDAAQAVVFDTVGRCVGRAEIVPGWQSLSIPPSGYAEVSVVVK